MEVNKTIAERGSSVIVKGRIKAPPVVGPNPGRTPKIKPNKVPKKRTNNNFELKRGANINSKLSI